MIWHDAQFHTHQTIIHSWIEFKKTDPTVKMLIKFNDFEWRTRINMMKRTLIHKWTFLFAILPNIDTIFSGPHELKCILIRK